MISEKKLNQFGCKTIFFKKGNIIYREGDKVAGYFQIVSGKVKLNNFGEDGNEFIQNIFEAPESFGEAFLFLERPYLTNATAITDCEIFHLSVSQFQHLLKKFPESAISLCENLSQRMYYKIQMSQSILYKNPEAKLLSLFQFFKNTRVSTPENYQIPLTRQQIADLTGLRVETVIRAIKKMEKKGLLKIVDKKIVL